MDICQYMTEILQPLAQDVSPHISVVFVLSLPVLAVPVSCCRYKHWQKSLLGHFLVFSVRAPRRQRWRPRTYWQSRMVRYSAVHVRESLELHVDLMIICCLLHHLVFLQIFWYGTRTSFRPHFALEPCFCDPLHYVSVLGASRLQHSRQLFI